MIAAWMYVKLLVMGGEEVSGDMTGYYGIWDINRYNGRLRC